MAMVLPVAKIGVDWPVGWKIIVMASIGSPSIFIAPGHDYVLACFVSMLGIGMYALAWTVTFVKAIRRRQDAGGRIRFWLAVGAAACAAAAIMPVVDAGLLRGVHLGLPFFLAAPIVLAIGVGTRLESIDHARGNAST